MYTCLVSIASAIKCPASGLVKDQTTEASSPVSFLCVLLLTRPLRYKTSLLGRQIVFRIRGLLLFPHFLSQCICFLQTSPSPSSSLALPLARSYRFEDGLGSCSSFHPLSLELARRLTTYIIPSLRPRQDNVKYERKFCPEVYSTRFHGKSCSPC